MWALLLGTSWATTVVSTTPRQHPAAESELIVVGVVGERQVEHVSLPEPSVLGIVPRMRVAIAVAETLNAWSW